MSKRRVTDPAAPETISYEARKLIASKVRLPFLLKLADALGRRDGVEATGRERELWLLETADFIEQASGFSERFSALEQLLENMNNDRKRPDGTPYATVPLTNGEHLDIFVSGPLVEADLDRLIALFESLKVREG
jgi:hypothetical protein